MKKRPKLRWLRRLALGLFALIVFLLLCAIALWWYFHPTFIRTNGIVYGQRVGQDLTFDVIQPARPNGYGVVFMVSGRWRSDDPGETPAWMVAPLLRRGYTVFALCHVSQPEATVMETIEDVHRGVRHIRHHATQFGINPDQIGVSGGSAGGHLSLMLATRGGPGSPDATDPVERESSAVQAVAIFYPVTDLLNLGQSTENPGDGGPPKSFVKAFGPDSTDLEKWKVIGRDCSPIYHITPAMPPVLIYQGDADTLTPPEQSEWFRDRAAEHGHDVEIVIHPGGQHGWLTMFWDIRKFADWFDLHLRGLK